MGNAALGEMLSLRRGPAVEERLTRPQRLLRQLSDLDSGRLRRLIRSGDLAPCFDVASEDSEECPICFHILLSEHESIQMLRQRDLHRRSIDRVALALECFLQLMPSKASKAVHCPFCKAATYAVEYPGARTSSEKTLQQEEDDLNIDEAKTRIGSKTQNASA